MASPASPIVGRISEHADALLGRPYGERGRGPGEYDCFGLFLELARRCGRDLEDPFPGDGLDRATFRTFFRHFVEVPFGALRPLDLVLQRQARQHVVTVVEPGWVLDTSREAGAHRTPLRDALERATAAYRLRCTE